MHKIDLDKPYHWLFLFLCLLSIPIVILCVIFLLVGGGIILLLWIVVMCEAWEPIEQDWRERRESDA